jgi:hypothetical protein
MNFLSLFGPLDIVGYEDKNTWESNFITDIGGQNY